MSKLTPKKKRCRDAYLVISRKKGWIKMNALMSRKSILNKISNNENWLEFDIDQKKQLLNSILSEYAGYLSSIGMNKSYYLKTKSYLMLSQLCNAKDKVLNKENFKHQWECCRQCALKYSMKTN